MTVFSNRDILAEFLTAHLSDPQGRLSTDTATFAPSGGTTTFKLPADTKAVTNLSIDGTDQSKWEDYRVDIRGEVNDDPQVTITAQTAAQLNGSTVTVDVKRGSPSWIYPDFPDTSLSKSSYPRIGMRQTDSPGTRLGNYQAPIEHRPQIQIFCFAYENQAVTINSHAYEGPRLAEYLLKRVDRALEQHEDELYPYLYNYVPITGPKDAGFDEERQAWTTNAEVAMRRISPGKDHT